MFLVTILDFETTGLDPEKDAITEIGAITWDVHTGKPVEFYSKLIKVDPELMTPEIEAITGISREMVSAEHASSIEQAFSDLQRLAEGTNFYVAHNSAFEIKMINAAIKKHGLSWEDLPWIDTMLDLPYPPHIKTRALPYLCADHGFLNPLSHRALMDGVSTGLLLSKYSWQAVIELFHKPTVEIIAHVSYNNKDKAKAVGFYWDGDRRLWCKSSRQGAYDATGWDFAVTETLVERPKVILRAAP